MQIKVVDVKFKNSNQAYKFSLNNVDAVIGDFVIVETERGLELGILSSNEYGISASLLTEGLKNVVRKALNIEVENAKKNNKEAAKYLPNVKKIVKDMNLEMKVISVECNFDFSKIVINFTSNDRVDFRALAKKLAEVYKTKIELRQIGSRDAVKILGGIGICGKECCCSQGYGDCEFINIKMAKNQNISLNPNSINGICGKLLCCLAYENKNYVEMLKTMPKINSFVRTPDGKGKVIYNNLFKQKSTVKIESEKNVEVKEFDVSKLKFDEN